MNTDIFINVIGAGNSQLFFPTEMAITEDAYIFNATQLRQVKNRATKSDVAS